MRYCEGGSRTDELFKSFIQVVEVILKLGLTMFGVRFLMR
jgi:hypothetical protein